MEPFENNLILFSAAIAGSIRSHSSIEIPRIKNSKLPARTNGMPSSENSSLLGAELPAVTFAIFLRITSITQSSF